MRVLKALVLIIAVLALGNYFVRHSQVGKEVEADVKIESLVKNTQSRLPLQVSDNATLDQLTYENRTLKFHGFATTWFPPSDAEEERVHDAMLANYCKMTTLVEANVPIEVTLSVPPQTLNDKVTKRTTTFKPAECRA